MAFQPCFFTIHNDVFFFSLAASTNLKDDDDQLEQGVLDLSLCLLHGVVGLGLLVDVEHVAHAHVAALADVLAGLGLVDHVPVDVAVQLGVLRPDAAMWRHLAAKFGTLGGDDGPAVAVL